MSDTAARFGSGLLAALVAVAGLALTVVGLLAIGPQGGIIDVVAAGVVANFSPLGRHPGDRLSVALVVAIASYAIAALMLGGI